jgi:hypothetical protein
LSLCATAHPLYTRFANIFGASVSEAATRPAGAKAPASTAERCAVARAFRRDYGVRLPMLVDAVRAPPRASLSF